MADIIALPTAKLRPVEPQRGSQAAGIQTTLRADTNLILACCLLSIQFEKLESMVGQLASDLSALPKTAEQEHAVETLNLARSEASQFLSTLTRTRTAAAGRFCKLMLLGAAIPPEAARPISSTQPVTYV